MRLGLLLITVLALACGGGAKSSPPPTAPLPPEEGAAPAESKPSETPGAEGEPAAGEEPAAEVCPRPLDDGKPKATPTQAEIDAMATRTIDMMGKMAAVAEANAGDCHKLVAHLRDFISTNCAGLNELRGMAESMTKQQRDAFNAKHSDKLMAVSQKMVPAFQNCQNDPALQQLMGQMQ